MAPRTEASLLARELHAVGATKEMAGKRLKEAFPSMAQTRRTQLLTCYWKENTKASDEAARESMGQQKTSQLAFTTKLFADGCSREEAKERLLAEYPRMGPNHRSQLLKTYWASDRGPPLYNISPDCNQQPAVKKRRLYVKQGDPGKDRGGVVAQAKKDFYTGIAVDIRSKLQKKFVPMNRDCFYTCLGYFTHDGVAVWRQAVAIELLQHQYYYEASFVEGSSIHKHVAEVRKVAWADDHDIMAAVNIMRRPIVIFKANSMEQPTPVLPTMIAMNATPIYLEVDETKDGYKYYSLLLPVKVKK